MNSPKAYKNFLLEINDGIAIFSINRPNVRNALNDECWRELDDFMTYAEQNEDIRVIIITGAGEKAFVSGADINSFSFVRTAADAIKPRVADIACEKIENGSKPVIAAVNGYAFGGGCELALTCDLRIVSENAQFGLPETNLGIVPGWGGTQRLSRLVGIGRAKEMILGGRVVKGQEAVAWGMAMKCVPLSDLMDETKKLAEALKQKGPLAIALAKRLIRHSASTDLSAGLMMEAMGVSILLESEDRKEGADAFFNKRKPEFKGR
jgi:enoyl-CoA hydratase